mmetsp:Transcript_20603/g.60182  ORF Transcript_20603/g.60182 Transcript_20603/m.60182 type:complete len:316 (-) Transcript_20603:80-1027(-)
MFSWTLGFRGALRVAVASAVSPLACRGASALQHQDAAVERDGTAGRSGRFHGKTVLITGGGGTFGRVGALSFVREGAKNVVLLDVNDRALSESLASIRPSVAPGQRLEGFVCDIRSQEEVQRAVRSVAATCGPIHLLWNNAGYQGQMKPLLDYESQDFKTVLEVNVLGAFHVLQAVARVMAENGGGAIVNTGSVAGLRGTPTMAAYVSSKAAIHGLTMTAAKDLAPHNIRVNTLMPALIGPDDGYMWKRQNELHATSGSPYFASDPEVVARNKINGVPLKRLGTVEEVVHATSFLLSDDAAYITGTSVVVAGGMA